MSLSLSLSSRRAFVSPRARLGTELPANESEISISLARDFAIGTTLGPTDVTNIDATLAAKALEPGDVASAGATGFAYSYSYLWGGGLSFLFSERGRAPHGEPWLLSRGTLARFSL